MLKRQCSQQAKLQNIESIKEGYDNCCQLPWQPHSSQLPRHSVQLVPGPELTLVIDFSLAKSLLLMPPSNGATVAGFKVVEHVECRNITHWNAWKILQTTYRYTRNGSFSWKQKDGYSVCRSSSLVLLSSQKTWLLPTSIHWHPLCLPR